MSNPKTVAAIIPAEMKELVLRRVEQSNYRSVNEYLRNLILDDLRAVRLMPPSRAAAEADRDTPELRAMRDMFGSDS